MAKRGRPSGLQDPDKNSWCSTCQKEKPKTEFYKNKSRSNGLGSRCKECNHANKRKRSKDKSSDLDEFILRVVEDEIEAEIVTRRMKELFKTAL